jgi:pilus assembly protein Flp/PilA
VSTLRMFIARTYLGLEGLTSVELEGEEGQTLAEYALILALIAVVVIGAVIFLGGQIQKIFDNIGSQI